MSQYSRIIVALVSGILLLASVCGAAIVDQNGGITIWVSYEGDLQSDVVQHGRGCERADSARGGESPGSCSASGPCKARDKVVGDIEKLARYIFESTYGRHFLRTVYLRDKMNGWAMADVRWHTTDNGASNGPYDGWMIPGKAIELRNAGRRCIHDDLHHEAGHYFYGLPDRYGKQSYPGTLRGSNLAFMEITVSDPKSVMGDEYPHCFVNPENAELSVTYDLDEFDSFDPISKILSPAILADEDSTMTTPYRADLGIPFAIDEWSIMREKHVDLADTIVQDGCPARDRVPPVFISIIREAPPGSILLLDGTSRLGLATRRLQLAAIHFQHSTPDRSYAGSYVFGDTPEELFAYEPKSPTLKAPSLIEPGGKWSAALALKTAIDNLLEVHRGVIHSAQIFLVTEDGQGPVPELLEQVNRARVHGVRIHTLAVGGTNAGLLRQVAESTDGVYLTLPGKTDPRLESDLVRTLTRLHGYQTEALLADQRSLSCGGIISGKSSCVFESSLEIPTESSGLTFYVFDKSRSSAEFSIVLDPPGHGNEITVQQDELGKLGHFVGRRISNPGKGVWMYRIVGKQTGDAIRPKDIEILVFQEKQGLQASVKLKRGTGSNERKGFIVARLENPYALTDLSVSATIDGSETPIVLHDDGSTSGDLVANDGEYTGVIDIDDSREALAVEVEFTVSMKSIPARWVNYEPGTVYEDVVKRQESIAGELYKIFAGALFETRGLTPRIESVDTFGRTSPELGSLGTLRLALSGARPIIRDLRISLGQGITISKASISSDSERLNSTVDIKYQVRKDAGIGARDLRLQFGPHILKREGVIKVKRE